MTDPVTLTPQEGAPYLAVDVQLDQSLGTFLVGESEVGGPDALAIPGTGWTNVVCTVFGVSYVRGAQRLDGALTHTEAGTCTVRLWDDSGIFDPTTNRDLIHKGTPFRVRAWNTDDGAGAGWDAVLFTGDVDTLDVEYLTDEWPAVTITAQDLVGALAAWESEGRPEPGVGAGDTLLQRAERVLDEVDRGTISPDSDPVYAATLAPNILAKPWQELTAAAEAELGRLFVDSANQLVVRARGSELSGPVRGTLSDQHGEAPVGVHCCASAALIRYGAETLANRALAGRRQLPGETEEPVLERRDDVFSQARYGTGTVDRRALELATDTQLGPWAEAVVVGNTVPQLRVESVTPAPPEDDLDTALVAWPAVMATDLGDRWLFLHHHASGRMVETTLGVVGMSVELTPDAWTITWTTVPAPPAAGGTASGWFVVGVSELGSAELLAPFAVPVPA